MYANYNKLKESRESVYNNTMKIEEHKLDNPVWNSLNEIHKSYSLEYKGLKFYNPEYCPFGGFMVLSHLHEK
jgi:hypothetical protein